MATHHRYPWFMLLLFGLLIGVNQMMALNFAALVTAIQAKYGVSDFLAGLLTLMNPITFLVFGFHAGISLDHHGYKKVISYAALLMTLGAFARSFDLGYSVLLVTHTLITISSVYFLSAIGKLASDWFPASQIGVATGVIMALMLLGTGIGMGATPLFVELAGWRGTLTAYAIMSAVVTGLFWIFVKEKQQVILEDDVTGFEETRALFANKNLVRVFWLSFLIMGAANAFAAWFEKIMHGNGFAPTTAGIIIGILLAFSVIGAASVPALSDKLGRRKPFLVLSAVLGVFLTHPLLSTTDFAFAATLAGASGLLQLPSYILLVALSAELAGQARAGLANSIVMLTSSLGGLIIAIFMERISQWLGWENASLILIGAYMISFFIALRLEEPGVQQPQVHARAVDTRQR